MSTSESEEEEEVKILTRSSPNKRTRVQQPRLFSGLKFVVSSSNSKLRTLITDHGGELEDSNQVGKECLVLVDNVKLHPKRKASQGPPRVDDADYIEGLFHVFSNWVVDCCEAEKLLPLDGKPEPAHNYNLNKDYLACPPPVRVKNPLFSAPLLPKTFTENDKRQLLEYSKALLQRGEDLKDVAVWEQLAWETLHPLSRFSAQALRAQFLELDKIQDEGDEKEEEEEEPGVAAAAAAAAAAATAPVVHAADSRYTAAEDEALRNLVRDAELEEAKELSLAELASRALKLNICPGRSLRSLTDRIKRVKQNPEGPISQALLGHKRVKFTAEDDEVMLSWWREWKQVRSGGLWGRALWEAAAAVPILPGKTSDQLFNRFHNRLSKQLIAEGEFGASAATPAPAAAAAAAPVSQVEEAEAGSSSALQQQQQQQPKWQIPKSPKKVPLRAEIAAGKNKRGDAAPKQTTSTTATAATAATAAAAASDMQYAEDVVKRLSSESGDSVDNVLDALYVASGDDKIARRVLRGEEPDSKLDTWTKLEDDELLAGRTTGRADEAKRRRFLGI